MKLPTIAMIVGLETHVKSLWMTDLLEASRNLVTRDGAWEAERGARRAGKASRAPFLNHPL